MRETGFPKTIGLDPREPTKAKLLAALKIRYNVAYQHLRYVTEEKGRARARAKTVGKANGKAKARAKGKGRDAIGTTLPRLQVAWVLREAWTVLLSQPAPVVGFNVISL